MPETNEKIVVKQDSLPYLADQPSKLPTPKIIAGGIGGMAFTLLTTVLANRTGVKIDADMIGLVMLAYGTILTVFQGAVAYVKRDRAKKVAND